MRAPHVRSAATCCFNLGPRRQSSSSSWKVVNIDKCRTFGGWGKLGEWLFAADDDLEPCLVVSSGPILPDCDKVFRPYEPGRRLRRSVFPQTAPPSSNPNTLVNLPAETVIEICSHLDGLGDLLVLSVSCQVLWEIGRHELYRRLARMAADRLWAGDRIICVGDYLQNDDLPENVFTPEEEADFTCDDDEDQPTLYTFPFKIQKRDNFDVALALWDGLYMTANSSADHDSIMFDLYPLLGSETRTRYKRPQPGVLRNLSKRQYVRESALFELIARRKDTMPPIKNVRLGNIVLSRICFSSDSSISMSYEGGIHRGVWAGDRFDIVASKWLEEVDEGWMDISDEAMEEMEAIWESEYGR
ncbi:hypothetical protein B0H15DRAFT_138440 [Mycena belliarum]|uniref:F-box domain-containing protein n=1 Tax=Mycena belliarum TaxID=1033014 RepID=A0AAD6XG31_9AGAR|nr:hypothetical protein B0H15DRAFT_138440 [Mycena belliae]